MDSTHCCRIDRRNLVTLIEYAVDMIRFRNIRTLMWEDEALLEGLWYSMDKIPSHGSR